LARGLGVSDRIDFVRGTAANVRSIGDASVDIVTVRSVLLDAFVKTQAFGGFFRVLRDGGRVSIGKPSDRDTGMEEVAAISDLQATLRANDLRQKVMHCGKHERSSAFAKSSKK